MADLTEQLVIPVIPTSVLQEVEQGPAYDPARKWLAGDGSQRVVPDPAPAPLPGEWDLGAGETAVLTWALQHSDIRIINTRKSSPFVSRFLPDLLKKTVLADAPVAEGTSQGVSINLGVIRKDNPPSVGMLHLEVAPFSMNLDEPKSLQRGMNFSP